MSNQSPDQQPQYAPPSYPAAPTYAAPAYAAPAVARTNVMAILSLVFAFVFSVLGVVFGHIALSQIKRTGESGHGLAIAGLVVGYIGVAIWVIYIIFFIVVIAAAASSTSSY